MKKIYVGRLYIGGGRYQWLGRFPTKKERDHAVAEARVAHKKGNGSPDPITCRAYAEKWLDRYERDHKFSSYTAARQALTRLLTKFGDRPIQSITRYEAREWADGTPRGCVKVASTMFNAAVDDELLERNPFRGLVKRSKGRSLESPPTTDELALILRSCDAHREYAQTMRALVQFAAYTGMRPGELFALEWADIDFDANRIHVQRRVYRGHVDTPKSNKSKLIALTPPARDAIVGLRREDRLVFLTKKGARFSEPVLCRYWALVLARAGLEFDFYLATKHWCVHYMHATLGLQPRVIAQQMGWSLQSVLEMLEIYGHGDVGALEEIDRAFAATVVQLRSIPDAKGA